MCWALRGLGTQAQPSKSSLEDSSQDRARIHIHILELASQPLDHMAALDTQAPKCPQTPQFTRAPRGNDLLKITQQV